MNTKSIDSFSPSLDVLLGIRNGLRGWTDINGLGPELFLSPAVEKELLAYLSDGTAVSDAAKQHLSLARARVVNFFSLLTSGPAVTLRPSADFAAEVNLFLDQLKEQADIWKGSIFHSLDFSAIEQEIYFRVIAKGAPALFLMGFADAIPHSGQVSRLCASMANSLQGRHSEVLQAAIVGLLHDPKFHPSLDLERHNLAAHPVNAAALAYTILEDGTIATAVLAYCKDNASRAALFTAGIVDALAVNDDSRFVQMSVILPFIVKRVSEMFGVEVAAGFKSIMETRLESHSKGQQPPKLSPHLHGCLWQIRLDSGLRGISQQGWRKVVSALNGISPAVSADPVALYNQLVSGEKSELSADQLTQLKGAIAANSDQILKVEIPATALLHHHQEVIACGKIAACALVIADPMMLSPHKVAAVYETAMIDRVTSYVTSFDDNIRLLPQSARLSGTLWQRAVLLSVLEAADRLNGNSSLLDGFKTSHAGTSLDVDVADLRSLVLNPTSWGQYSQAAGSAASNADVKLALQTLEAAYVAVVGQYRQSVYLTGSQKLAKFYPTR